MSLECGIFWRRLAWASYSLLLIWLFFQVSTVTVKAQAAPPAFENLIVELWPEYDRADVLVIYRAELRTETELPTSVTFRLPGYLETMNAVAFEENGSLFAVDDEVIEQLREDDALLLTFPASSHSIQLEYYDPVILTKEEQTRRIDFEFTAPYEIETASFEVQHPIQSKNLTLTPEAERTFTGSNGLSYSIFDVTGLEAGEMITLAASYQRNTDALSTQLLNPVSAQQGRNLTGLTDSSTSVGWDITVAYVLAGVGAVMLLGALGHWWWFSYRKAAPAPRRRPSARPERRQKRSASEQGRAREAESQAGEVSSLRYCYQCGTALRSEANFCHICGAQRRQG